MSYGTKLEESKNKGYSHAIATKILDLMDGLRLNQNENSARRWIWELIQNAKDVAYENNGISIEIDFNTSNINQYIDFKHNGKPFTTDNLTFLIQQVSTKDRKTQGITKTTGKFGTGFLTTHLLSEKVEVNGVIKDDEEPYKKFKLPLDRSLKTIEEVITEVENALNSLEQLDMQPTFEGYSLNQYNTSFKYNLNKNGIEVASRGLKDLDISAAFTLVFLPEIKLIKIINENIKYELSQEIEEIDDNFKIFTVIKTTSKGKIETRVALLTKNSTSIAIEIEYINGEIYLKEFKTLTPKLFCDFPLIGTEDFSFPVIINNSKFNPTEPRDGIYLTDKEDVKIQENKLILMEAVDLYCKLLEYASQNNWHNIYLLVKIPANTDNYWISKKWLDEEIHTPIKEKILTTPIVDTEGQERIAIVNGGGKANLWFPSASRKDVRMKIWELLFLIKPSKLMLKQNIEDWYETMWWTEGEIKIANLTKFLEELKNLDNLSALINSNNPIAWINSYYEILNEDKELLDNVDKDLYSVIPNQKGLFKAKSELKIDKNIEEELKNVLVLLDIDIRDTLLHKEVNTGTVLKYYPKEQEEVVNEINKIIKEKNNEENVCKACDYIISLIPHDGEGRKKREGIYSFCKTIFQDDIDDKKIITNWSDNIWQEAEKLELKWLISELSELKNIDSLAKKLTLNSNLQTLQWLNNFISFLTKYDFENLLNLKSSPILPNQNGMFHIKDDLFIDNGEIDEALKDISAELGYDFREELLDANIYLELPESRVKKRTHIAEEIIRLITPKFAELPRSEETKRVFKKLYCWFSQNKELAAILFEDLYKNKHKLYDDDEIAESLQKAESFDKLMNEFGIDDLSNLRQILEYKRTVVTTGQQESITQETLASLGVTSIEELQEALNDVNIANRFVHSSTPTSGMFQYAQDLINRAKSNVINYLKTLPDYDCSELEELATTVVGGVKREGLPIQVVIRPSDNGEVIVYYSSEKDSLDFENAELWIDNGIDHPRHLTLGKILKTTGINRIPIEMEDEWI